MELATALEELNKAKAMIEIVTDDRNQYADRYNQANAENTRLQRALDAEREKVKFEKGLWASERIALLTQLENAEADLDTLRQLVEVHTKQLTELTIIPIGCSREQELRWTQSIKDLRATLAAKDAGKAVSSG